MLCLSGFELYSRWVPQFPFLFLTHSLFFSDIPGSQPLFHSDFFIQHARKSTIQRPFRFLGYSFMLRLRYILHVICGHCNRLATAWSPSYPKGKATKPGQDGGRRSTCYRILFKLSLKAMSIHKVWWSCVFPPARQIFLLGNALDRQFLYPRCNITSASASVARCLSSFRGANFQHVSVLL